VIDQSSRRIGVYALVVARRRLLLTRVAPPYPGGGRWTLPGGGMEWGESPLEALAREVYEEVGLGLARPRPLDLLTEVLTSTDGHRLHSLQLVYQVSVHGDPRRDAAGSTDGVAWHPIDDLPPTVSLVSRALKSASLQSPP
jgi:8-oxo-dGTP diphosphatase